MFKQILRRILNSSVFILMLMAALFALNSATVIAQGGASETTEAAADPVFRDYKGVSIGMNVDEARKKLGTAQEKSDRQDLYVFGENEMAQVFYDGGKVFAIAVMYMGGAPGAPKVESVLGGPAEPKADGSVYKMIRYPKAGYWVSYSRSAGDAPLVTVTAQKINSATP